MNSPLRAVPAYELHHPVPLVQAKHVSKSFAGRKVLRDAHCQLLAGQLVALVGANGAGKTTLLRCLAGLIRPDSGQVLVTRGDSEEPPAKWLSALQRRIKRGVCRFRPPQRGMNHTDLADTLNCSNPSVLNSATAVVARRCVGIVSHQNQLYPHLTLKENLVFAARMYRVNKPVFHVDVLLDSWGLTEGDRLPTRLSQGMRQRYAIARALIHDPPVVLLDEPFVGLDQPGRHWLTHILHILRARDRAILFTSHELSLVQHADRVMELREGVIHERTASIDNGRKSNAATTERLAA